MQTLKERVSGKYPMLTLLLAMTFCFSSQANVFAEPLQGGVVVNDQLEAVVLKEQVGITDDTAKAKLPKQDCICFNNANVQIKNIAGQWKIVDNDNWLLDFGSRQDLAKQSLDIIQHYNLDNMCFVGRPFKNGMKMMYFLSQGKSPSGQLAGEDAIAFDPSLVRAEEINGTWKLVQDSMWMLDFGTNKEDAINAEQIVKYYGFTKQCFVGRPGPPLMYWRK